MENLTNITLVNDGFEFIYILQNVEYYDTVGISFSVKIELLIWNCMNIPTKYTYGIINLVLFDGIKLYTKLNYEISEGNFGLHNNGTKLYKKRSHNEIIL